MTLVTFATGCGGIREVMLSEASPDGSRTAYVVRVNSGGATTGFEYEIVVASAGEDFDPNTDRKWIWRSYRMPPTELQWDSQQSVRVQVVQDHDYEDMIQTREVQGIRAETVALPSEGREPVAGQPTSRSS